MVLNCRILIGKMEMQRIFSWEMKKERHYMLKRGQIILHIWISWILTPKNSGWTNIQNLREQIIFSTHGTMSMTHKSSMVHSKPCLSSSNIFKKMEKSYFIEIFTMHMAHLNTGLHTEELWREMVTISDPSSFLDLSSLEAKSWEQLGLVIILHRCQNLGDLLTNYFLKV